MKSGKQVILHPADATVKQSGRHGSGNPRRRRRRHLRRRPQRRQRHHGRDDWKQLTQSTRVELINRTHDDGVTASNVAPPVSACFYRRRRRRRCYVMRPLTPSTSEEHEEITHHPPLSNHRSMISIQYTRRYTHTHTHTHPHTHTHRAEAPPLLVIINMKRERKRYKTIRHAKKRFQKSLESKITPSRMKKKKLSLCVSVCQCVRVCVCISNPPSTLCYMAVGVML